MGDVTKGENLSEPHYWRGSEPECGLLKYPKELTALAD